MIQESKQGLEYVFNLNDTIRSTQGGKEEERKKQDETDAYMNKEEQIPEYQQTTKATMEHAKEQERVYLAWNAINIFSDSLSSLSSYDSS